MHRFEGRVYVTGYGPFGLSIEGNPSGLAVEALQKQGFLEGTVKFQVLYSSVKAISAYFEELKSKVDVEKDILISVGVWDKVKSSVQIERTGVNEMDFECADNEGFQPRGVPIDKEKGKEETAKSGLVLPEDFPVSDFAGKLMCNYALYRSLRITPRSVFIHVPEESDATLEDTRDHLARAVSKLMELN
uniref:Pyroglutamyl-peptidase I n=1 Tax=Chromera velia CCMP2878 TaxID=1169474 RepID=A0A0G4FI18_9ALVE|eukprot:Cvel_17110.t1-p1 / transcript=Cvel_17110.t1 / gene=Cvel_17110 / organism=Chromera_velia_CCMP2878 / gene_product=Pyrrolidone-carboxylate peptidase, putative / transcript_product=Pyrrolidone-carboxylate peptidase, putative / location=Cvel_scaffold1349:29187-29750(-) / protein_length=188 / sequence_SO=supercontig / SO=protein_coding / is_pseudo=false